jgi:hypothetical protein
MSSFLKLETKQKSVSPDLLSSKNNKNFATAFREEATSERNGLPILNDNGDGILTLDDMNGVYGFSKYSMTEIVNQPEQVILIGEKHDPYPEIKPINVAISSAVNEGQEVIAGLEINARPEYVELVNQLNNDQLSDEQFQEKFQEAVDSYHNVKNDIRGSLFARDILEAHERGAEVHLIDAPDDEHGFRDDFMAQTIETLANENPHSRIFIQTGNIHSQQFPGIPAPPTDTGLNTDFNNPMGQKLETALGDERVLSIGTVQRNETGIEAFAPRFDSWEVIVPFMEEQ